MSTHTQPSVEERSETEEKLRFAALTDDLALKILIAVATTVLLGRLGFDPTTALIGAALSPVFAEFLKASVKRGGFGRRRLLLVTLLLFLLHCAERCLAALRRRQPKPRPPSPDGGVVARRTLLVTGIVASVITVAGFTAIEAGSGNSLVADRPMTFFPREELPPDLVAPLLTLPADIVVETASPRQVWFKVSATDRRDGVLEPTCTYRSGTRFPIGSTAVRCQTEDGAGNKNAGAFTVTLVPPEDERAIQMRFPSRVDVEAKTAAGAVANFTVTARTPAGEALTPTCSPRSGSLFPIARTSVTCSAGSGAERVTRRFAVVVSDSTGPRLITPQDVVLETIGQERTFDYTVSARDLVDGVVAVACMPRSGSTFSLGTARVRCTAVDARGNGAEGRFNVKVVRSSDSTAPELDVPDDKAAEAASAAGAVVSYSVTADDDRGEPSISCTPPSGATFPLGSTQVKCEAIDAAGNTTSATFAVKVSDTRAPSIVVPDDPVAEATSARGAVVSFDPSAHDAVDGQIEPQCSLGSGSLFAIGTTEVTCTARDAAGNSDSAMFEIGVRDSVAPVIEVSGTRSEATSKAGAIVRYKVTARDAVDATVGVTCSPPPASGFPLGETSVSCKSTDTRGNSAEETFQVAVVDTTGPKVVPPQVDPVEATSAAGARVHYRRARAVDTVDGARPASCLPLTGSTFSLGATIVTCVSTDSRGNRGEATFRVTVVDTTPPVLVIDDPFYVYIDSGPGTIVNFPLAKDTVAGEIVPTCRPRSGSFFSTRRPTTVRCYAVDPSGNRSPTIRFTVTIRYDPG